MRTPLFLALVAGAVFCCSVQAQQVLTHFTSSDGCNVIPSAESSAQADAHRGASLGEIWPSWWQGNFNYSGAGDDRRGNNHGFAKDTEFCLWPTWYSSDGFGWENLDDCGIDGRDRHGWPGWRFYFYHDQASCSPIPEPSIASALLGLAVFGLALRARGLRWKRLA